MLSIFSNHAKKVVNTFFLPANTIGQNESIYINNDNISIVFNHTPSKSLAEKKYYSLQNPEEKNKKTFSKH